LSVHALVASRHSARSLHQHLGYILSATWLAYATRDLFPLSTYTLAPLDISDPFLWPKVGVLTVAGVVVPLCIPAIYIPVDPRTPTVTSPEQTASWLSFTTFSFLDPLIWKGYTSTHVAWDELPPLADYDTAEYLRARAFPDIDPFEIKRTGKKRRHLFFHLVWIFRREYALLSLAMAARVVSSLIAPIGLNRLLHYMETGGSDSFVKPWVWVLWLFFGPWFGSVIWEGYVFTTTRST